MYHQTKEVLYMSKIYISIYVSKATNISNLYHKLTKYSERVNNEPYKNSMDFHLTKRDIFIQTWIVNIWYMEEYIILNTPRCLNINYT